MKFLLAKKIGMTTIYREEGADNVTLLEVVENVVSDIRTEKKDGYFAIQVSAKEIGKNGKKILVGTREFRVDNIAGFKKGSEILIDQFEKGEKVTVRGISKGKGFQGVVKRYGFAGAPASHGHRHDLRAPGSIGSAFPERVMKGKKMAGKMGAENVTVKNLVVSHVDPMEMIVALKGAIPGNKGSFVEIRSIE